MDSIKYLTQKADELSWLASFYDQCGYGGTFEDTDDVYYAIDKQDSVIGVVRIAQEHGAFVLRGMQILPLLRGNHIGLLLLSYLDKSLSPLKAPCYCLAHFHLINFYGKIGFVSAKSDGVPEFLIQRKMEYKGKGLDIALLVRK
jgi:N-acetylglutamate synthase-like GNAT family acetyltransferase